MAYGTDFLWNHVPIMTHMKSLPAIDLKGKTIHTRGAAGTVVVDNSQTLFGEDTLHFSGTSTSGGTIGSGLEIDSTDDFTLGTGDFTIEGWALLDTGMGPISLPNGNYFYPLLERATFSGGNVGGYALHNHINIQTLSGSQVRSQTVEFYCRDFNVSDAVPLLSSSLNTEGAWRHWAVTRAGDVFTLFVNGEIHDRSTFTGAIASPGVVSDVRFANSIAPDRGFIGNMSNWRITKGFARYTTDFDQDYPDFLPPGPFPEDIDTGDYSTAPTGAAGVANTTKGPPGPDGSSSGGGSNSGTSGALGSGIILPPPGLVYDARNEREVRRTIMEASLRG